MQKVALVTGANRGIGYETCRQLAALDFQVILTSRNVNKGQAALAELSPTAKSLDFHQLDVTSPASIEILAAYIEERYGRLDVLINNAAVYLDEGTSFFRVAIEELYTTINTNVYGPFYLCQTFIPLMIRQRYGRVVNVSSESGSLSGMSSSAPTYQISKAALNALTRIVASEVNHYDIKVNSACPGWVRTDMGGPGALRSVEQGAETIVWLATLPNDGPTGGFFRDQQPIAW